MTDKEAKQGKVVSREGLGQPVGWEEVEWGEGGQKPKQEKSLAFSFPSPASIILPSEKEEVKVVEQQRLKVGFASFPSRGKGICRENISSPRRGRASLCGQSYFRPQEGASPPPWSLH